MGSSDETLHLRSSESSPEAETFVEFERRAVARDRRTQAEEVRADTADMIHLFLEEHPHLDPSLGVRVPKERLFAILDGARVDSAPSQHDSAIADPRQIPPTAKLFKDLKDNFPLWHKVLVRLEPLTFSYAMTYDRHKLKDAFDLAIFLLRVSKTAPSPHTYLFRSGSVRQVH